ncbi:PAS domain S-box protein [Clostridium kluyveri]|uniref:Diguanylate cyclase n=1 Tax=Clostridium kluyveri TaxID=1534 RepID=A0A1L5F6I4_CLOKL|nr:PAS domain S-box protein [Clostridium kluyveri]APM38628.1 diguanylate cyclase [Clostridium kluyveri]UZQ50942.1 PAS domain S-box protein [Clostridium kluyveri]
MYVVLFIAIISIFFIFNYINIKKNKELVELNKKFKLQRMYFEELFKNSRDGIVIIDNKDRIINVNESFEKIFQYKFEEIKGLFANDVIASFNIEDAFQFSNIIMHGGTVNAETKRKRKDGSLVDVNIIAFPFIFDTNQVGLCAMYKDIGYKKKSEQELQLQRLYFSQLLENSPEAICMLDNEDRIIDVNPAFEKLFGYTKEELKNYYINDRIVQKEAIGEAVGISKSVMNGNIVGYETFRMRKDKSLINVHILAHPILFEHKQIGVFGIYKDITEQKCSEKALKASEYTFRTLFESSSDSVIIVENSKIIDCNTAAVEVLGYASKMGIIGKSPYEISPEKQPDGSISKKKQDDILKKAVEKGKFKFEWWNEKIDGTLLPVEVMMTAILLNGKKVFHCLCRDITERKEMEQKLKYLSYRDQLTSLYNRRFFEEELKRMDVKYNFPLTVVMADVNGLKLINDSFGHTVGDELLKKVSEAMEKGCPKEGVVARLGGDEFVILMPRTDLYKARQIINDIKGMLLKEKVNSAYVDVSFGYECKINNEQKIEEVLKKSEDNMYKRKLFESPIMRKKTLDSIIKALYERNEREAQHAQKVSELCENMGKALGLPESEIEELKTLGLFHDIGKIAVDESILNKVEDLASYELEQLKRHSEVGYRILNTVSDMTQIARYTLAHHEKWDGSGYPKCLKGEEIPLQSRIIAIVDAYDIMINEKRNGKTLTEDMAVKELKKNSGTCFEPRLVGIFIEKVLNRPLVEEDTG